MRFIFLLSMLTLVACSSTPTKVEQPPATPQPRPAAEKSEETSIDFEGLQRSLGLERSKLKLGYEEKRFNTCEAGFGYPKDNCALKTFVSINFRLQCRDTVGTTSEVVTALQLDPIDNKVVNWQMGPAKSRTNTDAEGFAQINAVLANSPRASRLRLAVGNQFVYVRAGEISRIVTPANWCGKD